jgi:hypothetical protein
LNPEAPPLCVAVKVTPVKMAGKLSVYDRAGDVTRPVVSYHNCVGVVLDRNVPRLSVSYGNLEVSLERDCIRIGCAIIVLG